MIRFNAPPGWPTPPQNWLPASTWRPAPGWQPAPPGWPYFLDELGRVTPPPLGAWHPSATGAAVPGARVDSSVGNHLAWALASGALLSPLLFWLTYRFNSWLWSSEFQDLSWLIAEPLFWTLTTGPSVAVGALTRRAGFAAATAGLALVTTGVAAVALEGYDITTYLAFIGLALVLAAAAAEVIGVALRAARARSVGAWGTIGLAVPAGIMLTGLVKVSGIGPFSLLRDTLIEKWPEVLGGILLAAPVAYVLCGLLPALVSAKPRP